jgi:sortase (surface protein transpeptidase)
MASPKNKKTARRQSSAWRLPSNRAKPRSQRREYVFYYSIPFIHLKISSRNFRSRSKRRTRQLVIHPVPSSKREIIISSARPAKKKPTVKAAAYSHPRLRWQTALPAALFILAGMAGAVYFGTHLNRQVNIGLSPEASSKVLAVQAPVTANAMPRSVPVQLIIPKIGIDAHIAEAGLDQYGAVAMPFDIYTPAWYEYSPTPGELGPSVIVGHLDGANYANLTGIFWRLNELVPGDQITVNREDGSVAKFKVLATKQISRANFPTTEIYGNIKYAGLRVLTCGGNFDPVSGHYDKNTVVFAALE